MSSKGLSVGHALLAHQIVHTDLHCAKAFTKMMRVYRGRALYPPKTVRLCYAAHMRIPYRILD